ncbi:MAG TPA: hypothetical protein QF861_08990, partial [Alphaproteobacteria bacterium]|nr:hypothetical protein [Alphaproteobacteria bacterium]
MGAKNGNAGGVGATTDRNQGKSGADVVVGLATGDVLVGGAGDDHLSGLGGNDILVGGQGGDILSGGGGKDAVRAGNGDDRAVYSLSENTGSDFYDGGHGSDVLQLNLTPAEFFELRQELIDIQRWIAAGGDGPGKSDARGHGYETSFGLTFRNFESVEFQVEGYGSVDPANTPPEAVADAVAGSEDAPLLLTAADLLTNDSDADGD